MTSDPKPCEQCGRPHAKCTAHTRAGNPCGQKPMAGQTVCRMHGGSSPQALDAAQRRVQERQALLAVESFGLPREIDPHMALLEELHRTAGAVQWLGAVVADLDRVGEGDRAGVLVSLANAEARAHSYVALWQAERKHLVAVAKTCHDAGIEERRVRIAESAGQQLAAVVRAVLDRLQLSDEQRLLALSVVPEEFRRVSTDVVPGQVVAS